MTAKITTQNETWGWWGTMGHNGHADVQGMWDAAIAILVAFWGMTAEDARDFLDSVAGRHLADQCSSMTPDTLTLPSWTAKEIKRWRAANRR